MKTNFNVIYLGGPTMIIEIGGLRIITDPTLDPKGEIFTVGDKPGYWKTAGPASLNVGGIDVVLLSHDQHKDNLDKAGRKLLEEVNNTFTTIDGANRLGRNTKGLKPYEQVILNEHVSITATPARHGPAGTLHITGEVIGFIVETKDVQIYLTGDTVYYDGIRDVAEKFNPQYVFVFAGAAKPRGPFNLTMNANDVLDTANVFPDATIIPLHYEGWSHYTESDDDLRKSFDAVGISERLVVLKPGIVNSL
ncbi:MBL fold metallo-hydrolase [Mucilaginibacter sp. SMC90]|uniref:MBL fold metallo-hydrolase n=1 Tax=Mucilaginibacter sp. SMC90 TaxID=2929803 RepID=UPI001FB3A586|nr:MBL fold metallo-hydrolase [Mucilaginibacter sp. SMC90]UOE50851.1 MBL fold metallo-hydrolase [Mucilaginibacter sp. SMC90]